MLPPHLIKSAALAAMTYDPNHPKIKALQAQHGAAWKSELAKSKGLSEENFTPNPQLVKAAGIPTWASRALSSGAQTGISEKKASESELPTKKDPYLKTPLERGLALAGAGSHAVGTVRNIRDLVHDIRGMPKPYSEGQLMVPHAAGLGFTGSALLLAHLRRRKESQGEKKAADDRSLIERGMGFTGRMLYKHPVPTIGAMYAVSKAPSIVKAWREKETDEKMPVNYGAAVTGGAQIRHGDPEIAKKLVRRSIGY